MRSLKLTFALEVTQVLDIPDGEEYTPDVLAADMRTAERDILRLLRVYADYYRAVDIECMTADVLTSSKE